MASSLWFIGSLRYQPLTLPIAGHASVGVQNTFALQNRAEHLPYPRGSRYLDKEYLAQTITTVSYVHQPGVLINDIRTWTGSIRKSSGAESPAGSHQFPMGPWSGPLTWNSYVPILHHLRTRAILETHPNQEERGKEPNYGRILRIHDYPYGLTEWPFNGFMTCIPYWEHRVYCLWPIVVVHLVLKDCFLIAAKIGNPKSKVVFSRNCLLYHILIW